MLELNSNPAVTAKVRAMYGRRISDEQYDELMKRRSVSEIAGYLKSNTHFSAALANINESNIHRGQLEDVLRREVFNSYSRLYRYTNVRGENLFHYVIMEEEIGEILRMVQLLNAGNPQDYIVELPGYLIQGADIPLVELAKVRDFDSLLAVLGDTPYAGIMKRFRPAEPSGMIDYAACEHEFYSFYFDRMFQMLNKNYTGTTRRELGELLTMRIELLNLSTITRAKFFFRSSPDEIRKWIFPYRYKLTKRILSDLIEADGVDQLRKVFKETTIGRKLENHEFTYIENYTDRLKYYISRHYMYFSTNASVSFYAFVLLSQIELNNLISIIEGIRYQISFQEIKKLIIT